MPDDPSSEQPSPVIPPVESPSLPQAPRPPPPDILASPQLFQARIKANDVLQEHLKQIIAVASASLVLTITFLKELYVGSNAELCFTGLLPLSWLSLGASVVFSVLTIALMVNNLDRAELEIGKGGFPKAFAAGGFGPVQKMTLLSVCTFAVGMFSIGAFGAINYDSLLKREKIKSATPIKGERGEKGEKGDKGETEIKIRLSSDVLFDFDRAEVKSEAEGILRRVAWLIQLQGATAVGIDGYTDSEGNDRHNVELSLRRAQAVKQWLATHGGIATGLMKTSGHGAADPVAPNKNADGSDNPIGREANRRVLVVIRGFVENPISDPVR
jgi:outer membrane protein OmpA-like peptidoglycan-associated protein